MKRFLWEFWQSCQCQDLVEYSLLLGLLAVAGVLAFTGAGRHLRGMWSSGNSMAAAANLAAG